MTSKDQLDQWTNAFMEFLHDSNYIKPSILKRHNLENVYRLLFVPQCRMEDSLSTCPPEFQDVYQYMRSKGIFTLENTGYLKWMTTSM